MKAFNNTIFNTILKILALLMLLASIGLATYLIITRIDGLSSKLEKILAKVNIKPPAPAVEAYPRPSFPNLVYNIHERTLDVWLPNGQARRISSNFCGNDDATATGKRNEGPMPVGVYRIFTREQGKPTFYQTKCFLLDRVDSFPLNDKVDDLVASVGGTRTAFRIHANIGTVGCIATKEINTLYDILTPWFSAPKHNVYSAIDPNTPENRPRYSYTATTGWKKDAKGSWEAFENEHFVGYLTVVDKS